MKIKNRKRSPLISERQEIQSDPVLHESPEVKSRLISQLNSLFFKEKLDQLRRKYSRASRKELYKHLSDYLEQVSEREASARRFRG